MSQGPGGGGDSQDREDRPAVAGPASSANGPGGATDSQEGRASGQEIRSDSRENGAYGQVNGAEGRRSGEGSAGGDGGDRGGQSGSRSGGDTYDLYQRGLDLLSRGSAAAAAQLLARANTAEPGSRSVLEALARAQFDAHRYGDAADSFRQIVDASPADDYAQFGLGLALARTGNPRGAAEHLALAAAMRPDLRHYSDALRGVRATLQARREAGLPDQISPGERGRAAGSGPGAGPDTAPGSGPGSGPGAGPGQPGPGSGLTGTGPA
jgi:tetratricopeptide (TPR) repeat protein